MIESSKKEERLFFKRKKIQWKFVRQFKQTFTTKVTTHCYRRCFSTTRKRNSMKVFQQVGSVHSPAPSRACALENGKQGQWYRPRAPVIWCPWIELVSMSGNIHSNALDLQNYNLLLSVSNTPLSRRWSAAYATVPSTFCALGTAVPPCPPYSYATGHGTSVYCTKRGASTFIWNGSWIVGV